MVTRETFYAGSRSYTPADGTTLLLNNRVHNWADPGGNISVKLPDHTPYREGGPHGIFLNPGASTISVYKSDGITLVKAVPATSTGILLRASDGWRVYIRAKLMPIILDAKMCIYYAFGDSTIQGDYYDGTPATEDSIANGHVVAPAHVDIPGGATQMQVVAIQGNWGNDVNANFLYSPDFAELANGFSGEGMNQYQTVTGAANINLDPMESVIGKVNCFFSDSSGSSGGPYTPFMLRSGHTYPIPAGSIKAWFGMHDNGFFNNYNEVISGVEYPVKLFLKFS